MTWLKAVVEIFLTEIHFSDIQQIIIEKWILFEISPRTKIPAGWRLHLIVQSFTIKFYYKFFYAVSSEHENQKKYEDVAAYHMQHMKISIQLNSSFIQLIYV